ncbi:hypothetical protein QR680_008196 [Steinernema hermaphroditum]|uniref:Forkhead box protein O n=1 Tax=Steinernema hermaphroditum TaxID=289476 RepID=A0AA39IH61_9BILA|nr:hypothetical protein QR680_008196 [Steinernema hermaphroditum]
MAMAGEMEDDDFMVEPRGRCNTWPMQHHQAEEYMMPSPPQHPNPLPSIQHVVNSHPYYRHPDNGYSHPAFHDDQILPPTGQELEGHTPPKRKRNRRKPADALAQKKPNPWGEESYSDLIAKALEVAPEGRMKLNEIYAWFSENIPYFRERSSQEEAAGWKNSIRHNLSLHNRFMRIQNEGAGKSSWWVINPDAKPGRNPRRPRAATMEATSKVSMEKKRRGAKKRVEMPGTIRGPGLQPGSSLVGSQASIMSHDPYGDADEPMNNFDGFRPRTQSTISIPATTSRVSPSMEQAAFDEFDFPPWVDNAAAQAHAQAAAPHCVNELLDRTGQIRIGDNGVPDASTFPRMLNGPQINGIKTSPTQMAAQIQVKQEPIASMANGGIKTEINGVQPPPSYHELDPVRGTSQLQHNPLLRTAQLQTHLLGAKLAAPPPVGVGFSCFPAPMYSAAIAAGSTMLPWSASTSTAALIAQPTCGLSAGLPTDLENLNLPDSHSLMDLDMESLLRHELELSQNEKLGFD